MKQRLNTMILMLALSICFVIFGATRTAQAATYTVDTTADDAALTACTTTANDCSLRGAISAANSAAGADTINFDQAIFSTAQTIAFTSSSPKQHLIINSDLTIDGPGANLLTIKGYPIGNGTYVSTLFEITGGMVAINNLKLTGGFGKNCYDPNGSGFGCGGAISMSSGTLTVSGTTISGNTTTRGGGIYTSGGTLNITDSTISGNNSASTGFGGGIYVSGGSANIVNTTISGNIAGYGGGVNNSGGTLNINNSVVSGNTAQNRLEFVTLLCQTAEQCQNPPLGFTCSGTQCTGYVSRDGIGGGILNNSGTTNIKNSTISGNNAQGYATTGGTWGGGGIWNRATLTVANSTITGNYGQYGGGIGTANGATSNLSNSIVAGNSRNTSAYGGGGADIYNYPTFNNFPGGNTMGSYNLVQDGDTVTGTNNITGQDPKLAPLANNGGPTQTHALLPGSPALDAGDLNFDTTATPYDQRGAGFARKYGSAIDIGAFEYYPQTVNTLTDHDDGACSTNDCTLREAVKYATEGTTITFGVTGTIALTGGEIAITKNLTINGPAAAPSITVSGNNSSRIFYVNIITSTGGTLNFSNLTLSGGNGGGSGTNGAGGAIYIDASPSTVTITNSTISGNTASGNAGGIRGGNARLIITNSTISGNTAAGTNSNAGGLRFGGIVKIANSTISGNTAVNGGGIYYSQANPSYTLTLTNTIVAGNSATSSPDIFGTVAAGDYNLVQNIGGTTLSGTHNITGQSALLGALADNGGATKTMALLANSPAINAGDPNFDVTAIPFDQRGTGFARKVGSAIDIGAFEVQPVAAPTDLTITKAHTGNFTQSDTGKTYTITVTNSGETASSGSISVTDYLPAGLTATAISGGTGWSCTLGSLTCTRSDALAATSNYPAITLTVDVASNAPSSVTNTATVSGGGETNNANNTALDATTINAAATYSITGQVIYGTTPSGSAARGVPSAVFDASGTPSATATSDSSGIYQLSGLGSGAYTVTPSKSGDVNHITANDTLLVQQYGAYATNLTANQLIAADTNSDNLVNATDALYIQQYLAYVNTATANFIEQWKFLPASRNYTLSSNQTNQNYTAVLVGEVDGDWVAPGSTTASLLTASTLSELENAAIYVDTNANQTNANDTNANDINVNQLGIEKPRQDEESIKYSSLATTETADAAAVSSVMVGLPTSATSSTGTSVTIPITVSQLPALGDANVVKTYAFNVQYDATVLQYTGFDTTDTLSNSGQAVCGQPLPDATTNRIVACNYTNINGIAGAGTLLKLNFTVIGTSGRQSPLMFVGTARQPNPFIFNTGDPQATTNSGSFAVTVPTAATVSISGRVLTLNGRGIANVRLTLTDSSGQIRTAATTAFGYYRFDAVQVGETYILSATGKQYTFSQPVQVLNINEETTEVNFTANSEKRTKVF